MAATLISNNVTVKTTGTMSTTGGGSNKFSYTVPSGSYAMILGYSWNNTGSGNVVRILTISGVASAAVYNADTSGSVTTFTKSFSAPFYVGPGQTVTLDATVGISSALYYVEFLNSP